MSQARGSAALASAFLVRDWRIAKTYPASLALDAIVIVAGFAVTYFLSRAFAGADVLDRPELEHGYFAFAAVGMIVLFVADACVAGPTERLREDQQSGTLEMLASTPLTPWQILLGGASYRLVRAGINISAGLLSSLVLFGFRPALTVPGLLAVAIAILGATLIAGAIGAAIAAAALTIRRAGALTTGAQVAILITAGLYYPLSVLPDWLRAIGEASPVTWSVDLMRAGLLDGRFDVERAAGVLVSGVVLLTLARLVFDRAFASARRNGDLNRV